MKARMTTITKNDLVQSIADALQFISYYHPADYIRALGRAYEREQSAAAKDAIAQILTNSRMCAEGHRPICQDTGIVNVFLKVGMGVRFDFDAPLEDVVNEGVRRAYLDPDNKLRASVLDESDFGRKNTKDNTPAVINVQMVAGDKLEVDVAAKGGGSEAKSKFVMLNPSDSIADWAGKTVPSMGAGWGPPGMLGIGVGGTAEKAMLLAKESLMEPIDMAELKARGAKSKVEELRVELYDRVNALGIGAQGLGGLSTVLDVKIRTYPAHAANRPVAMIPNCAATRHAHFVLDGSGPAEFEEPKLSDWPAVTWTPSANSKKIDLDHLSKEEVASGKPGLIGMVGKAERGPAAIESIRKHKAAYLMAVGGAAYLVAKAIRKSRVLAFEDLGMEAIYEFEVQDMPVTVAVDASGSSVHTTGPAEWQKKIVELKIPVTAA